MFLAPDTELGSFQIIRLIGSGGMGDVYLARDDRLSRRVAVKVVRTGLFDARHRARFEQEARAASTLSHPNVAHIYQMGETPDGRAYLAMEYVEGETLAQRLIEPLPIADVLDIAIQISAALAAAHDAGIVHRDLKPANVIVRADGLVKVLDFGVAKVAPVSTAFARSTPTQSLPATEPGALVGSAECMSPEQARGQEVDARTDIWALGVVLYTMLTGRQPFEGPTRVDVLAAVLNAEPVPLERARPDAGPELRRIVAKALRKDRDRRYQVMEDLRLDLEACRDERAPAGENAAANPAPAFVGRRRVPTRRLMVSMVGVVLALGALLGLRRWTWTSRPVLAAQRLSVELGADAKLPTTDAPFAIAPDGRSFVFVGRPAGEAPQLFVRRLDQLAAQPLAGTADAVTPCFSPDGQWVAFFADRLLKKVSVSGGAVVTLADAPEPRGVWWAEDGTIVYAPHFRRALMRMSSAGGRADPLTTLVGGEISHRFPQVLPGGRAVLYTASTEVNIASGAALVVQDLASGARTTIARGFFGRYVPGGHVLYMEGAALFALPFDPVRLRVTGAPWRLVESVQADGARGSVQLAVSPAGTMAYVHGRNIFEPRPMAWMNRAGELETLRAAPAEWLNPAVSPDGGRIAMDIRADGHRDIWVYDAARDSMTRVTSDPSNEEVPIWTPGGKGLVYRSYTSSADPAESSLLWRRADGTGPTRELARGRGSLRPGSWHPSGRWLVYVSAAAGTDDDVMILPVDGDDDRGWTPGAATPFVNTPARERAPQFSPDGKWLVYASAATGTEQVYVQPFPGPGPRVVVSSTDGAGAAWSPSRPEIVFTMRDVDYRHRLMVVPYHVRAGVFQVDRPRPFASRTTLLRELSGFRMYAVHPDGLRAVIAPPPDGDATGSAHLTFVFNLSDELQRSHPTEP